MKKQVFLLIFGVVLLLPVAFWGCGTSDDESTTAPATSTILISPDSVSYEDGSATNWHTQYFTIAVYDENGKTMNNVDVNIDFVWANPDVEGLVQLYDGTTPVASPFVATTDENGVYMLRFDFQSGLVEYAGELEVRSGAAFASAAFEVTVP